ncbi:hypothetical protein DSECCO2_616750 [anaerobic digester metagenome]
MQLAAAGVHGPAGTGVADTVAGRGVGTEADARPMGAGIVHARQQVTGVQHARGCQRGLVAGKRDERGRRCHDAGGGVCHSDVRAQAHAAADGQGGLVGGGPGILESDGDAVRYGRARRAGHREGSLAAHIGDGHGLPVHGHRDHVGEGHALQGVGDHRVAVRRGTRKLVGDGVVAFLGKGGGERTHRTQRAFAVGHAVQGDGEGVLVAHHVVACKVELHLGVHGPGGHGDPQRAVRADGHRRVHCLPVAAGGLDPQRGGGAGHQQLRRLHGKVHAEVGHGGLGHADVQFRAAAFFRRAVAALGVQIYLRTVQGVVDGDGVGRAKAADFAPVAVHQRHGEGFLALGLVVVPRHHAEGPAPGAALGHGDLEFPAHHCGAVGGEHPGDSGGRHGGGAYLHPGQVRLGHAGAKVHAYGEGGVLFHGLVHGDAEAGGTIVFRDACRGRRQRHVRPVDVVDDGHFRAAAAADEPGGVAVVRVVGHGGGRDLERAVAVADEIIRQADLHRGGGPAVRNGDQGGVGREVLALFRRAGEGKLEGHRAVAQGQGVAIRVHQADGDRQRVGLAFGGGVRLRTGMVGDGHLHRGGVVVDDGRAVHGPVPVTGHGGVAAEVGQHHGIGFVAFHAVVVHHVHDGRGAGYGHRAVQQVVFDQGGDEPVGGLAVHRDGRRAVRREADGHRMRPPQELQVGDGEHRRAVLHDIHREAVGGGHLGQHHQPGIHGHGHVARRVVVGAVRAVVEGLQGEADVAVLQGAVVVRQAAGDGVHRLVHPVVAGVFRQVVRGKAQGDAAMVGAAATTGAGDGNEAEPVAMAGFAPLRAHPAPRAGGGPRTGPG